MVHPGTFTTARLRRYAPMFLAVFLVGCGKSATAPQAQDVTKNGSFATGPSTVVKHCDEGRAIYTFKNGYAGGIAIVENAPECAK